MMRRPIALVLAACLITIGATAWGYWSADSAAGGNAAAGATTVNQGPTPSGNAVGQAVTVSWAATTLANSQPVGGYLVKRYDSGTGVVQTILSACTGTITALSCVESGVPVGSWKYTVTPKIATNWVGQESSMSGTVTVIPADSTAPVNAITLSSITGGAFKSANTIYYLGSALGSFTLTNAVTDAGSGPASSQTATLGNTPTNWTHTPSTVSTPSGGPYVSNAFNWTAGATSAPSEVVTGRDVAGNTTFTNLSYVNDSTNPTNGTINYAGGYQSGRSVSITFTSGTDTGGSGVSATLGRIKRWSATLTGGVCGTYTAVNSYALNPTSPFVDTNVSAGMCYMYEYVTVDNVGNTSFATSAAEAKIDYAGAVNNTTGLLSHWRLGEASASLTASDSFNRTAASNLTGSTADIGGTWAYQVGSADTERISSEFRARRNGTGYSVNYSNATPASADYSVEADLYVKSFNTDDAGGVIGRLNTATSQFYMARWETDNTWNIVQWSGGAPTWIGTSAVQPDLTVGQNYRLRLELSGGATTTLRLYVNGVLLLTGTDTTAPFTAAGKAGIMDGDSGGTFSKSDTAGLHFENFQVNLSTYPRAADSKGSNTGDFKNGPTLGVAGALLGDANTAAQFDGVNDHVRVNNSTGIPTGAGVRSTELWFKTSSAARQVLFRYGTGGNAQEYGLWLDTGGTTMTAWGFGGGNDKQFTMPAALNNGAWHHVVQTYNGTSLTIYIDGVALPAQAATRATVMDMYGFGIGAVIRPDDGNSGGFFTGSIDEVSFYTTVLSQATVTNHYDLGTMTVPEPVVTTTVADLAYLENGTTAVDAALTVVDADSANLSAATVTLTTNYLDGQDTLAFSTQNGITGTWTAGTGVMALSGTATVAQYQTALRSITYNNNSNYPTTTTRTVTVTVSDGIHASNTASRNITITAVNDAPSGTGGTLTVNEDATYTFATADFGMYDTADNGAHSLLAVKMTTLPAAGLLKLSGVNVTVGQVVSAANITSGLLTYAPVGNGNGSGYTSFTFQVQDNGGTANSGIDLDASPNTFTFNVTAVNDAPVNSVPVTQSTLPDTAKVFSTGNANLISISDVDVSASTWQVQLISTNGATTLPTVAGLTFTVGDGSADATMTFTGTIASINTALNGLSFNPTAAFNGAASLQIVTNDQGNTGTGGTLTDSDTVTINVSGRPVVTTTVANLAYTENGSALALDSLISVTDSDSNITGATVSMTTNYVNGQDTLAFTNQLGITGSWSAATGVLTLSGTTTPASYQTAMRTITYVNSSQNPATSNRNVNFVASDAGGASNTASRQVAVTAVNDGPANTVPGTQTTAVNTAEAFTGGSLISIADVDASSADMRVQLVSTNGTSTISPLTGLSFSVGDGTADATMTFDGTVAELNAALAGLSFAPRADWVGTANLQIITSDQGNTGTGGTLTDDDTVDITVTSSLGIFAATSGVGVTGGSASYVNPTYTVVGEGTGVGSTADQVQYLYTTLTGDGTLTAQVASITNPCPTYGYSGVMMRDSLATNSMFAMADQKESGDNFAEQRYRTTNGGTSVNTQTAATVPEWVRITRTGNSFTTFRSADGSAWTAISIARTIAMGSTIYVGLAVTSTTDGCFNTSTFNNVSLTTPSVPPVLAASGGTTAHTENVPVVVDSGITVTDVDDTNIESGTVTVGTNYTAGQDVLAFTNQNGITGSYSAPTMTLTGSATKANWETALRSITYNNTSNAPNTPSRTINFVVNDGNSNSNTAAKTVSVAAVNDAPVNSMPAGQSTNMNIAEVFSSGNGNPISIGDDASSGDMRVQLVSTNGATTLSTLTGLSFTVGDGTADATMTFDGTVAEVNAALNGLSFNPTTSFTGAASLQIVTSDQGNTGTGGTLTDDDTVAITVTAPDLGIFTANQDIGGPGAAGSSSHSAGTYTVAGGGSDIWNNADQFQFLSMPMTGDGRLTARVVSQTQTPTTSNAAKAGVMFRETLGAGSIHGMMDVMKANGSEFHWRLTTNGPSAATTVTTGIAAPYWVRITRVGNVVTGERSPDGVAWTQQGATQSISMTSSIYVGLAVSAVDNTKLNTATFSNVTFEQPPVLAASGGTTAHTENVPVVVDSGITVTDATSANMASGTVTVGSGYTAGQDVLAFTNQNGISGSWSAPTMTLTGSATKANWQTALQSVTYNNTNNAPNTGNRTINFEVNDGSFDSNTSAKTVSVTAVNDAPVNTMPGTQTTAMDTALVFGSEFNIISITDADAASADMRVQLVSTNGATTLSTLTGLSFTVGDGTADATMTFDGTVAEVNAALSGLSFNPTTSFTGAASLQIVTSDQGNTGSGGTLSDNDAVAITVGNVSYFDTIFAEASLLNYYRLAESTTSSDTFTDTATTVLSSHTPEVGTSWTRWVNDTITGVITNENRLRKSNTAGGVGYYTAAVPSSANYRVEADVHAKSFQGTDFIGVVGRWNISATTGAGTNYLARYDVSAGQWQLISVVNGTGTSLGTFAQSLIVGSTYRLGLDMNGSTIRLLVDGVQRISVSDFSISAAGRTGVRLGATTTTATQSDTAGLHLDNFQVIPNTAPRIIDSEGTNTGDYFNGVMLGQPGAITESNTAALFDGVNDYGSITRQISTDFSIEFWFKSTDGGEGAAENLEWPNYAGLVDANVSGTNSDFGITLSQGGVIYGGIGGGGADVTIRSVAGGYDDGNWHYVVLTRTAATFKLYVDNAAVVNGTANNTGALTTPPSITFGRSAAGTLRYYNGHLDEIAFYNAVLSGASVAAHYAAR